MPNINLQNASLAGGDFSGCVLTGADVSFADLFGANLGAIKPKGPDGVKTGQLWPANLSGADLAEADLFQANLTHANTEGTILADVAAASTKRRSRRR